MRRSSSIAILLAASLSTAVWLAGANAAPPAAKADDKPRVTASAAIDRTAVAPGETFHLLVTLKMADDVHVYWRSPGGTGLPTDIEWRGPKGFLFGRTQFPAPEAKYDETLKETSWIHGDTASFLTPVKAAASAQAGTTAKFQAKVKWLACKKGSCVPGDATLELSVPVRAVGVKPTEETDELFDSARVMLPVPAAEAEHLKLSVRTDNATVKPGESFNVIITADIGRKHHMQSHKPLADYLIPAVVFVEPIEDAEVGTVAYPKAHVRNDRMLGKMSEYSGKVEFTIPIKLDKTDADDKPIDKRPRWVRGILQSQICSDAGTCFPPQYLEFAAPIRIEGGPPPAKEPDAFVERVLAAESPGSTQASSPETNGESVTTTSVSTPTQTADSSKGWIQTIQDWFIAQGYKGILVLAFLGGIILNLMPCVLPVISLKILSYVKQAKEDRGRILALGISYCAGILVFFGIISTLYYTSGQAWGEHFQDPYVVLILAAVITAFALSLFGVFAVFSPKIINQLGVKAEQGEGLHSAFFTGVLATILGTACTGPFMSAALGAASRYTELKGAMIFMAVGIGMMLPFLILSAKPGWLKFVPKPGPWMGVFEAIMGFILLGTVIWIVNPIRGQLGDFGLLLTLIFLLGVGIAVWLRGKAQFSSKNRIALNLACIAMLGFAWAIPFRWMSDIDTLQRAMDHRDRVYLAGVKALREGKGNTNPKSFPTPDYDALEFDWFGYDREDVRSYVNAGYTVFVDFTAKWCLTCKTNLKTSIDVESTRNLMRDLTVIPFKADYTRRNPEMKRILQSYGRAGVPLYLVFEPFKPDDPLILDEILTPGTVAEALRKAGPSRPEERVASNHTAAKGDATPSSNAP